MKVVVKLRDYQQRLFDKAHAAMAQGHKRVLVVAPTGAGKSYLFGGMTESAAVKGPVLVLIHRDELKKQHLKLFEDLGIATDNIRIESVFTEVNHLGEHPAPRLIIADEAHLSMAKSWKTVIDFYDTYTVGTTASPLRLDGKPLGDLYSSLVEDEETTVKALIKNKRLAPYEYYSIPNDLDFSDLKLQCGDYKIADLEKKMMSSQLYGDIVQSYEKYAKGKQALCFCVSIKHAKAVAEAFCEAGYKAASIDGKMKPADREATMNAFRNGEIQVLTNCSIISEGVSIDGIEAVILARRTASLALYIQMVGRALRYQEGKTAIILDHAKNYAVHGLPDDDRKWSLTKKHKPRKEFDDEGNLTVKNCPMCFKCFGGNTRVCPHCGYELPISNRELQVMQELELKKIEAEQAAKAEQERKARRREVGMAKTREELQRIAELRGYAPAWVWKQCQLKGIR